MAGQAISGQPVSISIWPAVNCRPETIVRTLIGVPFQATAAWPADLVYQFVTDTGYGASIVSQHMCHKPADLAYGFGSFIRIDENGSKPA
jgi:hypothetical protein